MEHEKFLGVCLCMNKFKIVSFGVKIMKGEIAQSALHFRPAPVQALSTLSQTAFGAFAARIINPNMFIIFLKIYEKKDFLNNVYRLLLSHNVRVKT